MASKRTILVTGGAGFIGSNYLNRIVPKYPDYSFVIVDALTAAGDRKNIEVLREKRVTFVKCDIRNKAALEKVFATHTPTDIIHFAAESHVDVSIKNPNLFIETNVIGTTNLLALAVSHAINRFHHISTDEVYGALSKSDKPRKEMDLLLPRNPYSASKAAAEHMVAAFRNTYGLDTLVTRCSNNYGPRQDRTKMIPLFITNLLAGKSVPLYGKGLNVRDWIYVDDHVDAVDLIFHTGKAGSVYNIGGNEELRNIDVAKMLVRLMSPNAKNPISFVADRLGHDFRYALDISKIKKEFGWKPKVAFKDGIQKTIAFYRR